MPCLVRRDAPGQNALSAFKSAASNTITIRSNLTTPMLRVPSAERPHIGHANVKVRTP